MRAHKRFGLGMALGTLARPLLGEGVRHEGESAGRPNERGRPAGGVACAPQARAPPPVCPLWEGRDGGATGDGRLQAIDRSTPTPTRAAGSAAFTHGIDWLSQSNEAVKAANEHNGGAISC